MSLSQPQRNAARLLTILQGDQRIPLDVSRWLINGFGRYLHHRTPLDVALGLREPSQWHPATIEARERRNCHLRAAGALLGDSVMELAERVRQFETRTWPRWREREDLPSDPLHRELVLAFRACPRVPSSAEGFRKILTNNGGGAKVGRGGDMMDE